MVKFFQKGLDGISGLINEKPIACFSIITFIFTVMGLYLNIEPLFLIGFFIALVILLMNLFSETNNFIMCLLIFAVLLGSFTSLNKRNQIEEIAANLDGEYARIEATVISEPSFGRFGQTLLLETDKIHYNRGIYDKHLKIRATLPLNAKVSEGSDIKFNGYLKSADDHNSYYGAYFLSKGISLTADGVDVVEILPYDRKNPILNIKNYILSTADDFFTDEANMLYKALTTGDKASFSDEFSDNLAASGLSHIVCVSGLHISILGMALYKLINKKNRLIAAIGSSMGVLLFILIAGAGPSTVRAGIMFLVYLVSKLALRENDSFTALSFSAMLLALFNPYVIFDWGFILSFLSVLGIEVFSKSIKNTLKFLPDFISDSVSVTISAQVMTLPACVNMFGYVSLYSIFANLMVSTVFVLTLYLCFIFIFVSRIPFINTMLSVVCTLFLDIIAAVASLFGNFPGSIIYAESFGVVELICYYVMILVFIFRKKLSTVFVSVMAGICMLALILNWCVVKKDLEEYEYVEYSQTENEYQKNTTG